MDVFRDKVLPAKRENGDDVVVPDEETMQR